MKEEASFYHSRPSRPASGTAAGRVWDIADEITRKTGRKAARGDVIGKFQEEGGNPATGSTQYHLWKTQYDAGESAAPAPAPAPRPMSVQVKEAGRIVLPADVRARLHIAEGDTLMLQVIDDEIRLLSRRAAVRRAQELVRQYIPEGLSLSEELIAERREEARRESQE